MHIVKKTVLAILVVILLLGSVVVAGIYLYDEPLPDAMQTGSEVEVVADRMLSAIGKSAYDSLRLIEWSHPAGHHYVWEKDINRVTVTWDDHRVVFFPEHLIGRVYIRDQLVTDTARQSELIKSAWSYYANDSFWLLAPFKIRDPGTIRSLVDTEEGTGLLVTYQTGGVTPGDSYLWILDDTYRPRAWRMWVSILPVGGVTFRVDTSRYVRGAWFATRYSGPLGLEIDMTLDRVE